MSSRFYHKWLASAVLVAVPPVGCARPQRLTGPSPQQECNSVETADDATPSRREIVAKAVTFVDDLLAPENHIRLIVGAKTRPPGVDEVRVLIASGAGQAAGSLAYVPKGQRCVLIHPQRLDYMEPFGGSSERDLPIAREEALALVLLHEAGHIFYRDSTGGPPPEDIQLQGVTLPEDLRSSRELRADLFAAQEIAASVRSKEANRFSAGVNASLLVTHPGFNLLGNRLLDDLGGSALHPERWFADDDALHAALELRFLIVGHAIHPSEWSQRLLAEFLSRRHLAVRGKDERSNESSVPTAVQPSTL